MFGIGTAHAQRFNVPPGRLGDVMAALGEQSGTTIAVTDPELAARRSPGVRGSFPLRTALDHALRGTGTEALFYDRNTVRIVRKRLPKPKPVKRAPPAPPVVEPVWSPEIVVTASKQHIPIDTYPGSVKLVEFDPGWVARNAAGGTAAITKLLPSVGSTNLGSARNKLFIRGIADSSFNGQTQATVGQYLGDVRLNYNAPDPNLNLYDMKRIEVLAGPQGTLYGASSLGGIIRLVPNEPDTHALSTTISTGISGTWSGGVGGDGAAMLNLPIADGRVAVRFVGFGTREAGYIDAPARKRRNINNTTSYGQRMAWRVEDLWGLTVDFGTATHNTSTQDGQYTVRGDPPLTRDNVIAQPFKNTYYLAYLTARRPIGRTEFVSTTSIVRHDLKTVFDATGHDGSASPARYEENNNIALISHETRLSGGSRNYPWVLGVSAIYNISALSRSLGAPDAPTRIAGVVNRQAEGAVFGQLSRPLLHRLTGTIGGRLTFARSVGNLLDSPVEKSKEPFSNELRFSPTLALDWHPSAKFSTFFHYQQGYRAGGLAVAPAGSALESRKFATDDLIMGEFGIRLGRKEQGRLSIRAAFFYADWNDIQADLIDRSGLPYTANIGSGRIYGLDGDVVWRPSGTLAITVSAFLNNSELYAPEPEFMAAGERTLPNVAHSGARAVAAWRREIAPGITLGSEASLRHVGASRLGVGPLLDIPQGNYVVGDIGSQLSFGRFGVSLDLTNLGNVRGNSFAFGNPFGLTERNQMTPLRPRTIRLGLNARF